MLHNIIVYKLGHHHYTHFCQGVDNLPVVLAINEKRQDKFHYLALNFPTNQTKFKIFTLTSQKKKRHHNLNWIGSDLIHDYKQQKQTLKDKKNVNRKKATFYIWKEKEHENNRRTYLTCI